VYVTNEYSNNVTIVNVTRNAAIGSVDVGTWPQSALYDGLNKEVYVANSNNVGQGTVTVISGTTVVTNITTGTSAQDLAIGPNGTLYVSNTFSNNISVINVTTNTVQSTISGGGLNWPTGEALDPYTGLVYVANYASGTSGTVTVLNGTSAIAVIGGLGSYPQHITFDSANGYFYVTNEYSGNVSMINPATNTVIGSITVGGVPWGITCDAKTGNVFVADENSSAILMKVISGAKVVSTIRVANAPAGSSSFGSAVASNALYVGSNGNIYANANSYAGDGAKSGTNLTGKLEVFSTSTTNYTVKFVRSGLPAGTKWWLNLTNGQHFFSTGTTITFKELNGTYHFHIAIANRLYSVSRITGLHSAFTVSGANVFKRVVFSLVTYKVSFSETGLPSGTKWWVNLSNGQSFGSNQTSIAFVESNGSYHYTLASANGAYTSGGSTFTVSGAGVKLKVVFT